MILKLLLIATAFLLPGLCHAQKTTGEIIAENWERGRQMREGLDARRAQREAAAAPVEPQRAAATTAPTSLDALVFYLNSKSGIPRIVVTAFTPTRCGKPWKMAVTMDKDGQAQNGCFKIEPDQSTFTVDWDNYGIRTYRMSEWVAEAPGSADNKALGE